MSIDPIAAALRAHALDEVAVAAVDDDRVGCATPFVYPDFDSVTVWVRPGAGPRVFEVTDYGEGFMRLAGDSGVSRSIGLATGMTPAAKRTAERICAQLGIEFDDGRIWVSARDWELGEYVFLVARASELVSRIGDRLDVPAPQSTSSPHPPFSRVVAEGFRSHRIDVVENHPMEGQSGRRYRAPIYLPAREIVVAALPHTPDDAVLGKAYMRFADITAQNGFKALSIFDDREEQPSDEAVRLLAGFGDVAPWSRREDWFGAYAR